jgi:hypothetical protein
MLSGSGHSELKSLGHWSSSWGARENNGSVDMGLITYAIQKWNLVFFHAVACGPGRLSISLMLGHAMQLVRH